LGVDFTGLLPKDGATEGLVVRETSLQHYSGKRLAVDAWNILYQFLASIRGPDGTPLKDSEGRITSHLQGLLNRTGALVEAGVRPVFVFDGKPHQLKSETLAQRSARKEQAQKEYEAAIEEGDLETARTKAQQTSRLTPPMVEGAKELLSALGIPVLDAPEDGEAQASWMAQRGLVDGVVSQDYDALLFGAPLLVRNLGVAGRRKLPGKQVWVDSPPKEIPLADSLASLGLTREQLVDVALLVGTDFHPGIKGIGAKKAITLIKEAGSLDALLSRVLSSSPQSAVERYIVEQQESLDVKEEVRRMFLEPAHVEVEGEFSVKAPDARRVREIMVERHGFNAERVESALGKYQAARGKQSQRTLF
jgi:flap endonuclease-1